MQQLPSHGQGLNSGAAPPTAVPGAGGGDHPSAQAGGQAWGWSVTLPTEPAPSGVRREPAAPGSSSSSTSSSSSSITTTHPGEGPPQDPPALRQRETQLGPQPVGASGDPGRGLQGETAWIVRVLGPSWAQPALESRPRVGEVSKLSTVTLAPWLASIHDDPRVSAEDAAVCAVLAVRKGCYAVADPVSHYDLIDAVVAASLGVPAQERPDKAGAMLAGLCRALALGQKTPHANAWVDLASRVELAARLAAPDLPVDALRRHVKERRGEPLLEAVHRALVPPEGAGQDDAKADAKGRASSPLLPSTEVLFGECPAELGRWCLAQGLDALWCEEMAASTASAPSRSASSRKGGWPLPLARGVRLAPLVSAQDPQRAKTQALCVAAIHDAMRDLPDADSDAILQALQERLLRDGPGWPAPVLVATVCSLASSLQAVETDDAEENERDPDPEFLHALQQRLLASPLATTLPSATRKAIAEGIALADDPLDWLQRQPLDGSGLQLDTVCELMDAALDVQGVQGPAALSRALCSEELALADSCAAITTVGLLLGHGVHRLDAQLLALARHAVVNHVHFLSTERDRLMARMTQAEGKGGGPKAQARYLRAVQALESAVRQRVPGVYQRLGRQLVQQWNALGRSWSISTCQRFEGTVHDMEALLRIEARLWREDAKNLMGLCGDMPDVLLKVAASLEALRVEVVRITQPDPGASSPGGKSVERVLHELPVFRELRRTAPAQAQRIQGAVQSLLHTQEGLDAQPLSPQRAVALLRAADCGLKSLEEIQFAAAVIAGLCGGAAMGEDCLGALVAAARAQATSAGQPGAPGAPAPNRAVNLLAGLWVGLHGEVQGPERQGGEDGEDGEDGDDDMADGLGRTVYLSIVARQLAQASGQALRMELVTGFTHCVLARAEPSWQGIFLRELVAPPARPGDTGAAMREAAPPEVNFLAVVTGLQTADRGLTDTHWRVLLAHLLETREASGTAAPMAMALALLLGAVNRQREALPAALTQLLRHLAVRPDPIPLLGGLARAAFDAWRHERNPFGQTGSASGSVRDPLDALALAQVSAPQVVARMVAVVTQALRDTPVELAAARDWLLDAASAQDALLVVESLEARSPEDQARLAVRRRATLARVAALGAGHAFALGWDRSRALPAAAAHMGMGAAVRAALTLPVQAGVQPEVQSALWRGGEQALEALDMLESVTAPKDGKAGSPLQAKAQAHELAQMRQAWDRVMACIAPADDGAPEGSKSRRTGTGRDRQDPADPGYGEKRKKRPPGQPPAGVPPRPPAQDTPAAGLPAPAEVMQDAQAVQLQAAFTQSLTTFSDGLLAPDRSILLAGPRNALEQWLGPRARFVAAASTPAAGRPHPADAIGVGEMLERLFHGFAQLVDDQVLGWHHAGRDLGGLAQMIAGEARAWGTLNSPHARRVQRPLLRALEVVEAQAKNPRPRIAPADARVSRETKVAASSESGAGRDAPADLPLGAGRLAPPLPPESTDDDADMALALSMSLQSAPSDAQLLADAELARSLAGEPPVESGAMDLWDF